MTEVIGAKTVLIPEHLSQELISGPRILQKCYLFFFIYWSSLTMIFIMTGIVQSTGAVLLVTVPLILTPPLFRRLTLDKPARELSRKIRAETECG